jgi:hypothetical protein
VLQAVRYRGTIAAQVAAWWAALTGIDRMRY